MPGRKKKITQMKSEELAQKRMEFFQEVEDISRITDPKEKIRKLNNLKARIKEKNVPLLPGEEGALRDIILSNIPRGFIFNIEEIKTLVERYKEKKR